MLLKRLIGIHVIPEQRRVHICWESTIAIFEFDFVKSINSISCMIIVNNCHNLSGGSDDYCHYFFSSLIIIVWPWFKLIYLLSLHNEDPFEPSIHLFHFMSAHWIQFHGSICPIHFIVIGLFDQNRPGGTHTREFSFSTSQRKNDSQHRLWIYLPFFVIQSY